MYLPEMKKWKHFLLHQNDRITSEKDKGYELKTGFNKSLVSQSHGIQRVEEKVIYMLKQRCWQLF